MSYQNVRDRSAPLPKGPKCEPCPQNDRISSKILLRRSVSTSSVAVVIISNRTHLFLHAIISEVLVDKTYDSFTRYHRTIPYLTIDGAPSANKQASHTSFVL